MSSVKNQDKRDIDGIFEMFNDNKTKDEHCSSSSFLRAKRAGGDQMYRKLGF